MDFRGVGESASFSLFSAKAFPETKAINLTSEWLSIIKDPEQPGVHSQGFCTYDVVRFIGFEEKPPETIQPSLEASE